MKRLLDRHRHAEQRRAFAAREGFVRRARRIQRTREVAHANRIDALVERLDPRDRRLGEFDRGNFFGRKGRRKGAGRLVGP